MNNSPNQGVFQSFLHSKDAPCNLFGPLAYRNDRFPYPLYTSIGEILTLSYY